MSETTKTHREIAADVVIAMLPHVYGTSDDKKIENLAEKVAEAYRTIYKVISSPTA